jgi:hypothetical protein
LEQEIEQAFDAIGTRAIIHTTFMPRRARSWSNRTERTVLVAALLAVDIKTDAAGEFFSIHHRFDVALEVSDLDKADRHLLLQARSPRSETFLCGHDERSWFVAAIPETAAAQTVQEARDALKPQEVWESMADFDVPQDQRDLRCTAGFLRQGEWFFLPRPWMTVPAEQVVRNEPIRRGNGKPHLCERLHRIAGTPVMVSSDYPNGLTHREFFRLSEIERRKGRWQEMVRDADVYVSGRVQHPDHQTIVLPYWHKVVMNTETRSRAMEHMVFLD